MATTELETDALSNLCIAIDNVLQRLSEYSINPRSNLGFSITDITERFTIWATNIGAKQKSTITTSLQFRVREAPKLGKVFLGRLQDLHQDLDDLKTALDEQPLSVFETASLVSLSITGADEDWAAESNPVTDVAELLKAASEDISGLFRLSITARKASGRDRYARALQKVAASCVLPEEEEIQQVTELYPTLRFPEFKYLKMQLVNANSIRRRYLKYCEEHQKASAQDYRVVGPPSTDIADTMTIGAKTRASGVVDEAFESVSKQAQGELESEQQSIFSYETQTFANLVYEVPKLEDTNGGKDMFICPFCRMEQSIKTQSAWKRHALADLKAYTCTFQECSLMFTTSREWFAHELDFHRKMQRCPYCNEYDASQDLRQHMNEFHADTIEQDQASTLLKSSVQELDRISVKCCQFCDWYTKITSVSPESKKGQEIHVSLQRYRRHVGAHLEEVALSTAVKRTTAADPSSDISEAEEKGSDGDSDHHHARTGGRIATMSYGILKLERFDARKGHDRTRMTEEWGLVENKIEVVDWFIKQGENTSKRKWIPLTCKQHDGGVFKPLTIEVFAHQARSGEDPPVHKTEEVTSLVNLTVRLDSIPKLKLYQRVDERGDTCSWVDVDIEVMFNAAGILDFSLVHAGESVDKIVEIAYV